MKTENEMTEIKLTRTGLRPLVFNGNLLSEHTTRDHNSTRWTNVRVFETKTGKIVVGIAYMTCWQGETDRLTADVFTTRADALSRVEENVSELASDVATDLNVAEKV